MRLLCGEPAWLSCGASQARGGPALLPSPGALPEPQFFSHVKDGRGER